MISAVAILLVVNMAPSSANAAAPKPSTPKAPTAPQMLSVTGVHPLAPHVPKPVYQAPGYVATATAWPAPASTTLHLRPAPAAVDPRIAEPRATTTGQTGHAGDAAPVVRAASAPLWAQALAGGPASVDLTITDQSLAQHLGIDGVVLTATAPTAGQVRVGIDYHSFAQVEGGNFGTRLGLVALPACALTTPTKIACQQRTLLPFTNDANTQSVSAAVGVPAVAASSAGVATAPSGPLVIAVVPLVSGDGGASAGTYSATTLKASGSWSAGGSTGSFGYSYPLPVPPAVTSLVPSFDLGYDSGSVDGQNASSQAQSSWVGDGWGTPNSFIEETYVPCASKPEGTAAPTAIADMCYAGKILTMSLNGSSSSLVWDATKSVWKPQTDTGLVVTQKTGTTNGTYDGDYWQVTGRDGTVYDFGLNRLPGWTTGAAVTNSADTEPVYSAHQPNGTTFTDPCWNATFTSSWCTMAYRWNLDYVVDVHHNAMAYFYQQDTNYYAQDGKTTVNGTAYTRDSHLDHAFYGFVDPNFYTTTPPDEAVFTTGDRCVSGTCDPLNSTNAHNWPDVPFSDICPVSTHCTVKSPTFFSTVRLASVVTQQYSGTAYTPVDTWTLTQTMPDPGDTTSPTLWLQSIVHKGQDTSASGGGSAITLPAVTFGMVQKPNRVDTTTDGLGPLDRYRISVITTETGSQITVTYTQPNPCSAPVTLTPASNTSSCYPVYWTPSGKPQFLDWFNKWVVQSVAQSDPFSSGLVTAYTYLGGAAWHYDDNELVQAKYRTYGQFRGYGEVQTRTGTATSTLTDATYYRGMSKDNNATVVNLTDSQGGVHEDVNQLAGDALETTTYTKDGGSIDNSGIQSYWVSPATATRTRAGLPDLTANIVAPVETWTRQAVTSTTPTSWRVTETDQSYDTTTGLLTQQYQHTDPVVAAYDSCVTTTFAPANTSLNLVGLPAEVETDQLACGGYTPGTVSSAPGSVNTLTPPASVSRPADVISDTRTFYDNPAMATTWPQPTNPTWPQAAPTKGDMSVVQDATDTVNGAPGYGWITKNAVLYDSYGRATTGYNPAGTASSTAYTMTNGVTTAISATNAAGQTMSTTIDTYRGLPITSSDLNHVTTTERYDALGRLIGVWTNSRSTGSTANIAYSYTLGTSTTPTVVTTKTLNDAQGTVTSTALYDGILRPIETQTPTPAGGRAITEMFYDTHGWAVQQDHAYWDSSTTPNGTMDTLNNSSTPNYEVIGYDGMGRPTVDTSYQNGVAQYSAATANYGDRTTTVPPTGGTAVTTITDPLGRPIEVDNYTAPPTATITTSGGLSTVAVSGGTSQPITYGYDRRGHRTTVTAGTPAETWTTTTNLNGQVTGQQDPDAGTSTITYDVLGNIQTSTDGRGKTLSFGYDNLGRKIAEYDGPTSASPLLANWTYDTAGVSNSIGQLVSSTTYDPNGNAYTSAVTGFNTFGEPTGVSITIPGNELSLAGTYTFNYFYTTILGLQTDATYPANGGLPAEDVSNSFTSPMDLPSGVNGTNIYTTSTSYDGLTRPTQENLGSGTGNTAFLQYAYETHLGRLHSQTVLDTNSQPIDATVYTYDNAGNITHQSDTRQNTTTETQCYTYDGLDRLTQAWTASDNCNADPTTNNGSTVADPVSGGAYWTSWQYNPVGDRLAETQHSLTGGQGTTTTSTFNPSQPDTLTATTTTGPGGTSNASYTYDAAGNTLTRNLPTSNQTLTWNDQDQLASTTTTAGTTGYIYDASGSLLLRKDPGNNTLFLPGEQLAMNTTTNTVTGTRFIALPSGGQVVRTGPGTNYTYEFGDLHNSATLTLDHTAQTPTWRQFTPYGAPRGTAPTSWPDQNGFLGAPVDTTTGLTRLGARDYDPTSGRFVSIDPVFQATDPNQIGGYTYSGDNPATHADPTGRDYNGTGVDITGAAPTDGNYTCAGECGGIGHGEDTGSSKPPAGCNPSCPKPIKVVPIKPDQLIRCLDTDVHNYGCTAGAQYIMPPQCEAIDQSVDIGGHNLAMNCMANPDSYTGCSSFFKCLMTFTIVAGVVVAAAACAASEVCAAIAGNIAAATDTSGTATTLTVSGAMLVGGGEAAIKGIQLLDDGEGGAGSLFVSDTANETDIFEVCETDSFSPDTQVLLADGTSKAIKDIKVGDQVLSTDPTTSKTSTRPVTQLHDNLDTDLTDVTITTGSSIHVIHTTTGHLFWDATTHRWTGAGQLRVGDQLGTTATSTPVVVTVHSWIGELDRRNLTVDGVHTYYIVVGGTPVLVHNEGPGCGSMWMSLDKLPHHYMRFNSQNVTHAEDFGVTGPYNQANAAAFITAIQRFVENPGTEVIEGTFRGQAAIHYVDPITGLHASFAASGPNVGEYLGGWKSTGPQLTYLLQQGVL